jgi:hypothetical protein
MARTVVISFWCESVRDKIIYENLEQCNKRLPRLSKKILFLGGWYHIFRAEALMRSLQWDSWKVAKVSEAMWLKVGIHFLHKFIWTPTTRDYVDYSTHTSVSSLPSSTTLCHHNDNSDNNCNTTTGLKTHLRLEPQVGLLFPISYYTNGYLQ